MEKFTIIKNLNLRIKRIISYNNYEGDLGARASLEESGIEILKIPRPSDTIIFKD